METPRLFSMHKADRLISVVSAASIIAKAIRDYEIQKIRETYPDIGSGYPSDQKTMRFVRQWVLSRGSAPVFARRSWKPLRLLLDSMAQKKII
jgi:ribonuclease HII